MANEITLSIGLTVANGNWSETPIPTQQLSFDQASPGSGGVTLLIPPGIGATGITDIALIVPTPGMVAFQNISQNGAVVILYWQYSGSYVPISQLNPGQIALLPNYGGAPPAFAASTPISQATLQMSCLQA